MRECIVFFATAWGALYGGINSFNYDLCKALAKYLTQLNHVNLGIVCIVSEGGEPEEAEAEVFGVKLIVIPCCPNSKSDLKLIKNQLKGEELKPMYFLGHDVHTGQRAINLSEDLSVPVAIFHHMDYESYKSLQVGDDQKYVELQRGTLEKAQIIFAIGPKLKDSAYSMVEEKTSVIEVLPGLADINIWNNQSKFSAITFGRLEQGTNLLKQTSLAVASFAKAVAVPGNPLGYDAGLKVVGFENEEGEEYNSLKKIVEQYTSNYTPLHPWKYNASRVKLFDHLRRETVCMMLSIHEGFGLTGLEAISAGVPLILSKNTGLYLAIKNTLKGSGTGRLHPVNVLSPDGKKEYHEKTLTDVAHILLEIAKNKGQAKEDARSLKQDLAKLWTWENTAFQVLKGLGFLDESTIGLVEQYIISEAKEQPSNDQTVEPKLEVTFQLSSTAKDGQETFTKTQASKDRVIQQEKMTNVIEFKLKNFDKIQPKSSLLPREELEEILQDLNNLIGSIQTLIQGFKQGVYSSTTLEKLIDELKKQREISRNLEKELRHKNVRLVDINSSSNLINKINQSLSDLLEKVELIVCSVPDSNEHKRHLRYVKNLAPTILEEAKELKNGYQRFLIRLPIT